MADRASPGGQRNPLDRHAGQAGGASRPRARRVDVPLATVKALRAPEMSRDTFRTFRIGAIVMTILFGAATLFST